MKDAHNHLQDSRIDAIREDAISTMRAAGITRCVSNGTHPDDWEKLAQLATRYPKFIIPSFGLHPWKINPQPAHWITQLRHWLARFPHAGIGECGLDKRIRETSMPQQIDILRAQIQLAAELKRPLSIHCVQAWGALVDTLESQPLPPCGFLLHAYSGSKELIPRLSRLGAFFSVSGSILHPGQEKKKEMLRHIPADRLLLETDAPDGTLPDPLQTHSLPSALNHPANLTSLASQLAHLINTSQCDKNFDTLFGNNPTIQQLPKPLTS